MKLRHLWGVVGLDTQHRNPQSILGVGVGVGGSFTRALKVSLSDGLNKEVKTFDLNIQTLSVANMSRGDTVSISVSKVYSRLHQ